MITAFDALGTYWHVPIKDEGENKTTFLTHLGTDRYTCLPIGLRTTLAMFQHS